MEGDELFDANMLEQKVSSLIERGKRNFAINLAKVDYLYSDSINKFINLNHKVLNVYGRLALLSPSGQVQQILQRAGIQNFLKIYGSFEELKRASDEIISQTSSINVQDVQQYTQQPEKPPVSEFEDFRSEIGKAIEATPHEEESVDNLAQTDSAFVPQEQTFGPVVEEIQTPDFSSTAPPFNDVPFSPNFSPAAPPPQDFAQPSMPPPPPLSADFDYSQMPSIPSFDTPPSSQPQFATPEYPGVTQSPGAPAEFEQAQPPAAPPPPPPLPGKPPRPQERPFDTLSEEDRFDDEEFEKKKFPIAAVLIPLILLMVISGGVYLFLFGPFKSTLGQKPVTVEKEVSQEIPQIAVKEEPEEEAIIPETVEEPEITPEPVKKIAKTPVKKKVTPKPRPKPKKTTPKKTVTKPAVTSKIVITSIPPSATVSANGKTLGKTPYTWSNPSVYGMVSISVDKSGYKTKKMNVEFTGGTVNKHFELERKPVETKPKPKPKPVVTPTPKPTTTAKPTTTVSTTPTPKPVTTLRPKPITTPTPSATSGGTPASIFISSLPPMADVYMDGKKIGKTNIAELKISTGKHTMRFVKGAKELTKTMTFTSGKNPSQLIRLK